MNSTKLQQVGEQPATVSKLYLENTLLRVSGALFCHDQKRAALRTDEIEVNGNVADRRIVVRPDPRLGQPGPLAHKIFVALLKKHSDYGRPIQPDISFSKRELSRLIGRKTWGGHDSAQLTRALEEIHYTFIRSSFRTESGKWAEHSFSVFPEIYLERSEHATDPIERCTVTLARPIVASLQEEHFTCLNHTLMQELGTIGQALYMRLFFHFSNLYDGHHKRRLIFPKRYDDICREWLGGLKVHAHRSLIERDQLGPHLSDLVRHGFLASYSITDARNGNGMILTFRPGAAFFADYDRFYRNRLQGEMQFQFTTDRKEVAEPLKLAYAFLEKRDGQSLSAIPYVPSKDVETAKLLLEQFSFEEANRFIVFGLREASRTNFDVRTLGGLRQYLDAYRERQGREEVVSAAAAERSRKETAEAEQFAYQHFCNQHADALLADLPSADREAVEALARTKMPTGTTTNYMGDMLLKMTCRRIITERYQGHIPSFADWKEQQTGC